VLDGQFPGDDGVEESGLGLWAYLGLGEVADLGDDQAGYEQRSVEAIEERDRRGVLLVAVVEHGE
jgi:hypothetical protein